MNHLERIKFDSYRVLKFLLQEPGNDFIYNQDDLITRVGTSIGIADDDSAIQVMQEFRILQEFPADSKTEVNLVEIDVEAVFSNFDIESFPKSKNDAKIPEILIRILVGLTASTTRGVIITKTAGSSFGSVILPVLDPKGMITEEDEEEDNSGKATIANLESN
jgi:hypothetical protein